MSDKLVVERLKWDKHHGVPGLRFGVGLQSVFDRGAKLYFDKSLIMPSANTEKMIFRGHSDHTTDKVYFPTEAISNEERNAGLFLFVPFIVSPKPKYHKIEFQRRDVWAVAGRHGEDEPFGLSWDQKPGKLFLPLAFPNETGKFPDTFILIEKKNKGADPEYVVIKFSSDFAKPKEFVVGEPVVVSWEVVDLAFAPECLQKAVEDRKTELEEEVERLKKIDDFVNSFAKRMGLTRQ